MRPFDYRSGGPVVFVFSHFLTFRITVTREWAQTLRGQQRAVNDQITDWGEASARVSDQNLVKPPLADPKVIGKSNPKVMGRTCP